MLIIPLREMLPNRDTKLAAVARPRPRRVVVRLYRLEGVERRALVLPPWDPPGVTPEAPITMLCSDLDFYFMGSSYASAAQARRTPPLYRSTPTPH